MRVERRGHLAPRGPAADPDQAPVGVQDLDRVQVREVDHHPAGVGAVPERAVAAGAHGHRQVVAYGVPERRSDLIGVAGPDHDGRAAGREERARRVVVPVVAGPQDLGGHRGFVQVHRLSSFVSFVSFV